MARMIEVIDKQTGNTFYLNTHYVVGVYEVDEESNYRASRIAMTHRFESQLMYIDVVETVETIVDLINATQI